MRVVSVVGGGRGLGSLAAGGGCDMDGLPRRAGIPLCEGG